MILRFLAPAALIAATPLSAQQAAQRPPAGSPVTPQADDQPQPLSQDDIVVTGLRDLNDTSLPANRKTLDTNRIGTSVNESHQTFESSMRVFNCGIKPNMRQIALLRAAVDGTMDSARQDNAQRRLVQANAACSLDTATASRDGIGGVAVNDYTKAVLNTPETFYYDRGAMFVRVLQVFAPHLKLTRAQTEDPAIQMRLAAREAPRAKLRLTLDRRYFDAAICFVRYQPKLSVDLALGNRAVEATESIEAAIVNGSRECIGSARHVFFDPSQFRFYIADAVYRWAVAAAGVDTLIVSPSQPAG